MEENPVASQNPGTMPYASRAYNSMNFSAKLLSNGQQQQQQHTATSNPSLLYNPMTNLFPQFNNSNTNNSSPGNNSSSGSNRFLEDSSMNDFNNNSIIRKDFNPFTPGSQENSRNNYPFGSNTFNTNYLDQNPTSQINWPIVKNEVYSSSNGQSQQSHEGLTTNPFMNTNYFDNPFISEQFNNGNGSRSGANNLLLLNGQCPPTNGSVISSDNEDIMSRSSANSKAVKKSSSLERKQAPTIATGRRNLKNESVEPDEAERRMKRRERNRRSAQKCRERKVQRTQELQAQVEALKVEANSLLRELDSWRMQAKHCVQLLRQHCPHVAIPPMYFACLAEDERLSRASQIICNTNNPMNQNIQCENTDRTTETLPSNGTFSSNSGILDEQVQLDYNASEGISASTHSIHSCTPNSNGSVEHSSSMPENMNGMDSTPSNHNHSGDNSMVDVNSNCIPRSSSMYQTPTHNDIKPKDIRLKSPCGLKTSNSTPSPTAKISPSAYSNSLQRQLGRLPSGGANGGSTGGPNELCSSTCSSPLNYADPFTSMANSVTPTTTISSQQLKLEPM